MNDLENKKWKEFKIKDLFITFNGTNGLQVPTGSYINKKELYSSNTPRITVRDTNNGVDSFSSSDSKSLKVFENFISVSFLGSVFYHPYKASLDMKVHCLQLLDRELNKHLAKFLIIAIKNNIKNSSYGNQLSSTDLPQKKILLPIDENEKPDYSYMENYIKEIEKKQLTEYYNYITKELESLDTLHTHTHTRIFIRGKKLERIFIKRIIFN